MTERDNRPVLVLFRRDLRVADNGALAAAAESGKPVLPVFILDEESAGVRPAGGASRWWLHRSLAALGRKLDGIGLNFVLREGTTVKTVAALVSETGADTVYWNRRYEPGGTPADAALKTALREGGIEARSFDGHLLHEPSLFLNRSGSFYKVYTPFWNAMRAAPEPRPPLAAPHSCRAFPGEVKSDEPDRLVPLPKKPDWAGGLRQTWEPGEDGAQARLEDFLKAGLRGYTDGRDRPDEIATSRLSPHLAHGEITPFQIFAALDAGKGTQEDAAKFRKEIVWREFCYHLLHHRPRLHEENFNDAFDGFGWKRNAAALSAWQRGRTGYPVVDAGMRELWRTGIMHNRVRMIAASFLVKHLLVDWREGERWFWDTLVDADPASNPGNWQWVAGSGADASPWFRIFNPVLQGETFDPRGGYVRRWVPEVGKLPDRYIHRPWEAPETVLADAGVRLGETYPKPVVDHGEARERALAAYRATRRAR